MLILLPLIVWYLLFVWIHKNVRTKGYVLREKLLFSFTAWCVLLTMITEILSVMKQFTFFGLLMSWGVAGFFLYRLINKAGWKLWPSNDILGSYSEKVTPYTKMFLVGVLVVIVVTGLLAVIIPPNNWDAMFYRLPRVMHAIQNKSVDFYPTHITQQIYLAPWVSYVLAHFQLLSGGDYFANTVQWICMVYTLVVVSLIAMRLGANIPTQIFSVVFAASIPMGILQSSSTQSDYVVAFWLASFVYMGVSAALKNDRILLMFAGLSLGLALYTKSTAILFAPPFFIWMTYMWYTKQHNYFWKPLFTMALFAGLISSGYIMRNLVFSGKPVFTMHDIYINQPLSLSSFISSTVKNTALQYASPFPWVDSLVYQVVQLLHTMIGVDINLAGLTIPTTTFRLGTWVASEDFVANPLHFFLIVYAMIALFFLRIRERRALVFYSVCTISSFLIFTFFIRWQPWNSRLHLPIFILFSPVVTLVLEKIWNKKLVYGVMGTLLIVSAYYLFWNVSKSVISFSGNSIFSQSREQLYFVERVKPMFMPYQKLGDMVAERGYTNIGLVMKPGDNEYGLWHVLQKGDRNVRIEHVHVENQTKRLVLDAFVPELVIVTVDNKDAVEYYKSRNIPVVYAVTK